MDAGCRWPWKRRKRSAPCTSYVSVRGESGADAPGLPQPLQPPRRLGKGPLAARPAQGRVLLEGEGLGGLCQAAPWVFFGLGEVLEEAADVGVSQVTRVSLAVAEHEPSDPVGVALAGLGWSEGGEGCLADLIQQAQCRGADGGGSGPGQGQGTTSLRTGSGRWGIRVPLDRWNGKDNKARRGAAPKILDRRPGRCFSGETEAPAFTMAHTPC